MHGDIVHIVVFTSISAALILFRTAYRLLFRCHRHASCHRTWHQDDLWMAFSFIPLVVRGLCIAESVLLTRPGRSDADWARGRKLLFAGRICYAFFLWCLKLCLINFYSRFDDASTLFRRGLRTLWWAIVLSFIAVLLVTMFECWPLHMFWQHMSKVSCTKSYGNLLSMAGLNILTDLGLMILPLSVITKITLSRAKKIQLCILFSVGIFVVVVTVTRIPLILDNSVAQETRSLWASIEIATACIVSNVAFYYALIKDLSRGHDNAKAASIGSFTQDMSSATYFLPFPFRWPSNWSWSWSRNYTWNWTWTHKSRTDRAWVLPSYESIETEKWLAQQMGRYES